MILPDLSGLRPPHSFCKRCGFAFRTLGMNSKWVRHAEWCPRNPFKNVEAPLAGTEAGEAVDGTRAVSPEPRHNGSSLPAASTPLFVGDVDDFPRYGPVRWPEGPSALSDMVRG
jgi:hypothetical protein